MGATDWENISRLRKKHSKHEWDKLTFTGLGQCYNVTVLQWKTFNSINTIKSVYHFELHLHAKTGSIPTICWCLRSFVIWVPFSSILMTNLSSSFCRSCLSVDCWVASIWPTNSWYSLWKAGHHKLSERFINPLDFSHHNTVMVTLKWSYRSLWQI